VSGIYVGSLGSGWTGNSGKSHCSTLCRLKYEEAAVEVLVYRHHCCGVVKLGTIVWSRKYCNQMSLAEELIPVFYDLAR